MIDPDDFYAILKLAGFPARYQVRPELDPQKVRTGISFDDYRTDPVLHGDGDIQQEEDMVQVDIFSFGDTSAAGKRIRRLVCDAGWRYEYSITSQDTLSGFRLYHRIIFFSKTEEV